MSSKEKKMIIILVVITIIVSIIYIIRRKTNNAENENVTEVNMTKGIENVTKIEGLDGIELKDIQVTKKNDTIRLMAIAENKSTETLGDREINIIFKGENGEEILKFKGYLGKVEAGKEVKINAGKMTKVECSQLYSLNVNI